ncbi:MAG: DNA gyrase subunit A, partial [Syntrophobacteraceae bacterium CG07_land_8_20_14_0_80_61_8]
RAIPDVRDGLKPVHRRILFAMHELKNDFNKPYKKSARIVGDVIGKFHPHGDIAVYDALVRMAQDFSMRCMLVDGQGNFGSIDGDPPAAMRYTEVRMARIAHDFLQDIEKETVELLPNYDNSILEPTVLPTRVPNLLLNGSSGIAVGMATNIPPHNLGELCDALQELLQRPEATISDLMRFIKGPDFPTGAIIHGTEGIREAYETGRGSIKMRARIELEESKSGKRQQLVVTELPFQVNKTRLLERIAELVKDKRITGIHDIRDESDRDGTRVVVMLKTGEAPKVIESQLYKYTSLEMSFGVTMLAVVDNRPVVLNLKDVLVHFLNFRREIIVRRTQYELKQAEKRLHILEGLKTALDHLDAIIELIRAAENPGAAKAQLMERFNLSEIQAQAILDMRLQRLTGLEREKILEEYRRVLQDIERYRQILDSPQLVDQIIADEVRETRERYANERRSVIIGAQLEVNIEDLIEDKDMVVTISRADYIKRTPVDIYRSQRRGGKGRTGMNTRAEDLVATMFTASAHDYLLIFTNQGRVYWLKVYEIPEVAPAAMGKAVVNLLPLQDGEKLATILPVRSFDPGLFVVMATKRGIVKKTALMAYSNPRSAGIRAIVIDPDDELICARITDGARQLFLMSRTGKCIRVEETQFRPLGRVSRGVKGMELAGGELVGMEVIEPDRSMLVVSARGYGKRTANAAYNLQNRGGQGVINLRVTEKNGEVVGFRQVSDDDGILLITDSGRLIRTNARELREMGRATQGVKLMDLDESERIVDLAAIIESDDDDEEDEPS